MFWQQQVPSYKMLDATKPIKQISFMTHDWKSAKSTECFAAVCDFRYLWIHIFNVSSKSVFCWEVLLLEAKSGIYVHIKKDILYILVYIYIYYMFRRTYVYNTYKANSWEQFDQYFWNDLHFTFLVLVESGRDDVVKHHHLLMDVWCNNHISCNELESSELKQLFMIDYLVVLSTRSISGYSSRKLCPCLASDAFVRKVNKWRVIFVSSKFFGETHI